MRDMNETEVKAVKQDMENKVIFDESKEIQRQNHEKEKEK